GVLSAIALVLIVTANVGFASAQSTVDPRLDAVLLYRALGRDLPADGLPLVVSDVTIHAPNLFEDFPYTTAYVRRPVLLREGDGRIRLPGVELLYNGEWLHFGGEDVRERLLRRGGDVYVVYDRDARTCTATDVPLPTASHELIVVVE